MADVLVVGVAVADLVMRVDDLPRKAEKFRAKDAAISVGGCAANAAIAIARHGGEARLAARLGGDLIGGMIASGLEAEGVDIGLCDRRDGAKSSFSSIYVDRVGERQIMNFRGSGLADTLNLSATPRPQAVLADNRWPQLTLAALKTARRWGVPAVVDAEAPFDAESVRGATHIVFSMQGLCAYAPGLSTRVALERASVEFDAWIAVTDGANGTLHTGPNGISRIAAFHVEAVDTLAAGDIWHGVFALRLAEGAEEPEAVMFANAAAALKCRSFGGIMTCPYRPETEALIREKSS